VGGGASLAVSIGRFPCVKRSNPKNVARFQRILKKYRFRNSHVRLGERGPAISSQTLYGCFAHDVIYCPSGENAAVT